MILAIRTDNPTAELYLYDANGSTRLESVAWEAHRKLADTIHLQIDDVLKKHRVTLGELTGIVVYKGPGSYTGLRIGVSVGNTLAYALDIPIVGTQTDNWLSLGMGKLHSELNDRIVMPFYGGEANIGVPKK